ncbi:TPA: hypothetical protein CPT88_09890 [Candidatus Gastranaerophilales bacterium HUM_8]|nr:MAG TPA: hypothetical protein CPT88_09890 [Candidatus Gastranaerophilales bacterium HUM_8]DAB24067.1 MAG TPA: hypothetical protein CPT94_00615 [Candidatus Gastranaerophilales bacterium HUM_22]
MKKILLTTLLMVLGCAAVQASMVIIDYQGETVVRPQSVERNLIINSDDGGVYNIAVRPLEDAMRSVDGNVTIPLSNLYINNTREDVYLRYNEYSNIFDGLSMGGVAKNMTAKIRDFGMVPAGTYAINFEVQATDLETGQIAATSTFNLQFIIPPVQEISLHNEVPRIVLGAEDAFNKSKKVSNETSPMIYINSNCEWELALNADNFGDGAGDYYVRTVSASSGVNERLLERVLLTPGKEIVIAKGKAPANNEYISVEYSLEGRDKKFIPSGNYENRVKYILREIR